MSSYRVRGSHGELVVLAGVVFDGDPGALVEFELAVRNGEQVAVTPTGPYITATDDPADQLGLAATVMHVLGPFTTVVEGELPSWNLGDEGDLYGPITKHQGPGPHEGTGTSQMAHGRGGGGLPGFADPASLPADLTVTLTSDPSESLVYQLAQSQRDKYADDEYIQLLLSGGGGPYSMSAAENRDRATKAVAVRQVAEELTDEERQVILDDTINSITGFGSTQLKEAWERRSADLTIVYSHYDGSSYFKMMSAKPESTGFTEEVPYGDNPRRFEELALMRAASDSIALWASTSNDNDGAALGRQELIKSEFKLSGTAEWKLDHEQRMSGRAVEARDLFISKRGAAERVLLRAQYRVTQRALQEAGITQVVLFRGQRESYSQKQENGVVANYSDPVGSTVKRSLRPASAWSTNYGTARSFSIGWYSAQFGVTYQAVVPAERILSMPGTGMGCLTENEMVVLGGTEEMRISHVR